MNKSQQRRDTIYRYIVSRLEEGCSPTMRELCTDLDIASTSTVHGDLHQLVSEGLIEMQEGRNRTIRLPGCGVRYIPFITEFTDNADLFKNAKTYIPVSLPEYNGELFAFSVCDNSMAASYILKGDTVVARHIKIMQEIPIEQQHIPLKNGDLAIFLHDNKPVIKQYAGLMADTESQNLALDSAFFKTENIIGKIISLVRILP